MHIESIQWILQYLIWCWTCKGKFPKLKPFINIWFGASNYEVKPHVESHDWVIAPFLSFTKTYSTMKEHNMMANHDWPKTQDFEGDSRIHGNLYCFVHCERICKS